MIKILIVLATQYSFCEEVYNKLSNSKPQEENLEQGRLFYFSPAQEHSQCHKFTYKSPGDGCLRVEIWGAGGSGAKMCCCGQGVPGNPGAYVVKCFLVFTSL